MDYHPRRSFLLLAAFLGFYHSTVSLGGIKRGDGRLGSRLDLTRMLSDADGDDNGVITSGECNSFISRFDANDDGNITRCEWTMYSVDHYDGGKLTSLSAYDLMDVNGDNIVQSDDLSVMGYDFDGNGTVEVEELGQGLDKEQELSKNFMAFRMLSSLSNVRVPSVKIRSTLNIPLLTSHADADGDGMITRPELQELFIVRFDADGDYKVTRCEFVMGSEVKYGDWREVASAAFDNHDINNNNYLDIDDLKLRRFDQDGDGKLTTEEFSEAVKKADWIALKSVFPSATTPAPPVLGRASTLTATLYFLGICVSSVLLYFIL